MTGGGGDGRVLLAVNRRNWFPKWGPFVRRYGKVGPKMDLTCSFLPRRSNILTINEKCLLWSLKGGCVHVLGLQAGGWLFQLWGFTKYFNHTRDLLTMWTCIAVVLILPAVDRRTRRISYSYFYLPTNHKNAHFQAKVGFITRPLWWPCLRYKVQSFHAYIRDC